MHSSMTYWIHFRGRLLGAGQFLMRIPPRILFAGLTASLTDKPALTFKGYVGFVKSLKLAN